LTDPTSLPLAGKIAVVTGASRGLGKRICEAFVRRGAQVAMLARTPEALSAAAAELGPGARAWVTDIADPKSVLRSFEAITESFGGVDILVNNAAVGHLQPIEEADDALLQEEIATNLLGPIYCIRSAIPHMRNRGGGDIVNITSESVRMPYPFLTVYAAAKSAIETLSLGLRTELRSTNIRVSVLRSGRLAESGFNRHWPEERRQRYREIVLQEGYYARSGEPISPEITAQAIVDLVCLPRQAHVPLIELSAS
jgi:meso-butanediol dehydrogenase / (S,S)-butanediol dehydrogenase / diacetyl reductase